MGPRSADEQTAKANLRIAMREVRRAIAADPVARARRSSVICERVVAAVFERWGGRSDGRRLMAYRPLPGEPDLQPLTAWALTFGVAVFHPSVDGLALRVDPGDADPMSLDVVVVPGLAFTVAGLRLGQGGGHFDRFLPRLSPACLTIGVGFGEQLVETVPVEPHDVVLDLVITDS